MIIRHKEITPYKTASVEDVAAGLLILHHMGWHASENKIPRMHVLRGKDKYTGEILIDEDALMRMIMIANPCQKVCKLKFVSGE